MLNEQIVIQLLFPFLETSVTYRPEIDGLRALAVLSVILFHAGFPILNGGYLGVDIFFVISGYLITGILLKELKLGKLSIINYYYLHNIFVVLDDSIRIQAFF
jgi:peptidoglycan/LPS O-acetylase OafA/YrhL